ISTPKAAAFLIFSDLEERSLVTRYESPFVTVDFAWPPSDRTIASASGLFIEDSSPVKQKLLPDSGPEEEGGSMRTASVARSRSISGPSVLRPSTREFAVI